MIFSLVLLATLMVHHVLIGTVLFAVVQLFTWVTKPSPELKCTLWTTAFVVCTVSPLLLMDSKEPVQAPQTESAAATVSAAEAIPTPADIKTNPVLTAQPKLQVPATLVYEYTSVLWVLLSLWALGSLHRMIAVGRSAMHVHSLMRCSEVFPIEYKGLNGVRLVQSDAVTSPMAVGLLAPAIILPKNLATQLTESQLLPVILHELAHIKRNDLWVGLFQETLAILFWWSPIMRLINRKIHINRELACDLQAVRSLNSAKRYAQSLIDCTRLMLKQHSNLLAMGLFSKKKELQQRVNEVVKPQHRKAPNTMLSVLAGSALAVSSVAAAQQWVPAIDIAKISQESNHFSSLSEYESERLLSAIDSNNLGLIQAIVNKGVDINTPLEGDGTALMVAIGNNNMPLAQALLDMGADPNQSSLGDGNPLIVAAKRNSRDIIALLINSGADVNAVVPYDETPLINASRFGSLDTVKLLVDNGADVNLGVQVNEARNQEYRSPLNVARTSAIRQYLVSKGATQ